MQIIYGIITEIDERTGNVVNSFYNDSVTLDLAHPDFHYWAIRANTTPADVGSVECGDYNSVATGRVAPGHVQRE
jgi:hypothetical protein